MFSEATLRSQLGQLNSLVYAQKFQLEAHRSQLESNIMSS
jgi:hypothetical protein